MSPRWLPNLLLPVLLLFSTASAALKLAPTQLEGEVVEDLPAPYQLQAVTLNQSVTLNWTWNPPDPGPVFESFGYEVVRGTSVIAIVHETAYSDFNLPSGVYSYKVRVKGGAREMRRKIAHVSAWSESATAEIKQTCMGPPVIRLSVEPTQKVYGSIPALRLHFTGDVKVPEGCTLSKVMFHIDSGMSTERAGSLFIDSKGLFNEFVDAMGVEEEPLTGGGTFKVFVTARDEAGDAASPIFNIDMNRRNPFAPK